EGKEWSAGAGLHRGAGRPRLPGEAVARIRNARVHVRLVEVEITMRDGEDVWVDLDPGDLNARAVSCGVLPRRGAAGKPKDCDVGRPQLRCLRGTERVRAQPVGPQAYRHLTLGCLMPR